MHRVLASTLLVLAVGCVAPAGDESFIIRQNLAAPESGSCTFTPSLTSPTLARGVINLNAPIPYIFAPLFESRITAAAGKESLRTVFINGADVELTVGPIETQTNGQFSLDETVETVQFRSLFSAPLPPNGGLTSGSFDLVPLSVLAGIRDRAGAVDIVHAQITATATAFGDYYGDEIESAPFQFPVTACNDCVLAGVSPANLTPSGFKFCDDFTATARQGNPCNPFQDGIVDCCDAGDGTVQCPAETVAPKN
jgi:hypothetical protein